MFWKDISYIYPLFKSILIHTFYDIVTISLEAQIVFQFAYMQKCTPTYINITCKLSIQKYYFRNVLIHAIIYSDMYYQTAVRTRPKRVAKKRKTQILCHFFLNNTWNCRKHLWNNQYISIITPSHTCKIIVATAPVRYNERQSQAVAVHLSLPPVGLKQKIMTTCFITNSTGYRNIK